MKIHQFRSENVKKLSVVEITPTQKGVVIVAGKNGQGKSSVLDSIQMAIGGAEAIPSKAVRRGEDKARVDLDLGELTVTRTITADGGGSLVVRDKDGEKQKSPQEILDKLFGRLSFDPLDFKRQKPAERSATLRELLGLNFSTEDEAIKVHYDERTVVNREVKAIEARLQAMKDYPEAPADEESTAGILSDQAKALEHNSENARQRRLTQDAKGEAYKAADLATRAKKTCSDTRSEIERLQALEKAQIAQFDHLTGIAEQLMKKAQALTEHDKGLTDIDLAPFAERAKNAEVTNAKVRVNKQKAELRAQLKTRTKVSDDLTSKIEALEKQKRQRIINAKFPVDGLSLSDTKEVLFNGIPFDQASTAEQLRVSVAMGLAMNPKLRVLLIRQGNDLDSDNLKLIGEMAEAADAQIWLERVESTGDTCVVIEDGHVKTQT